MNARQENIVKYFHTHRTVKNNTLAEEFKVSLETIRRDLMYLEKQNIIIRMHGGAYLNREFVHETDYLYRANLNSVKKKVIAEKAIHFVKENEVIGLDVSTTNTQIAIELTQHFKNLTILTNSIVIAIELAKRSSFQLILPGGSVRNEELCFVGESSAEFFKQFHMDVFFMSFSGVSLESGFTDYGFGESQLKKAMFKQANRIYGVGDSSKFSIHSLLNVAPLLGVEGIITDDSLDESTRHEFEACGVNIF
ncbi:DeoR/GlpR family DNA-binding transcription regulator [Marinilactibacillus sp. XAAS-LB27]|uniref:DeoR/GlpR family DNA-binding transcription regulator n=1 Tax=Marinilactibacillus sp. XAAS-LB27 TaxID=3114538 RepID=UPI002E175E7C|nr:DeoR/GlpR family DNA-binding transcription regulator [Marinilactibacillus sp. XAAS-LB27]